MLCRQEQAGAESNKQAWRREVKRDAEDVSRAGLRKLRQQIDEGASVEEMIATVVHDVIVDDQELLTTEVMYGIRRSLAVFVSLFFFLRSENHGHDDY